MQKSTEESVGGFWATVFAIALTLVVLSFGPAQALTMQECSAKYQAAKAANALQGMTWNDFRKSQCRSETPASSAASPTPPTTQAPPASPLKPAPTATPPKPGSISTAPTNAVFPSAVSPKYSSESPGKARMHTCLDQYNLNKSTNANGGLRWIMKGGGYYSECNKRLKP